MRILPEERNGVKRRRVSFGKIEEILDMPNLIEVQKKSYQWFLDEGLRRCFGTSPQFRILPEILFLEFIDYT